LPETGAPQARLSELAKFLKQNGHKVTILTSMPNYPTGKIFKGYHGLLRIEEIDGIKIIRCYIYPSNSKNIILRLINYFSFVISSLLIGIIYLPRSNYLITESPPLFLGISGFILSKIKKSKWVFNVSDLWPESAVVLGIIKDGFALKISQKLEEFCYKKSWMVTGQSNEIVQNIKERFPEKLVHKFSNGVDINTYNKSNKSKILTKWSKNKKFTAVYAGLHGIAQGLDQLIFAAKEMENLSLNVQIILIGDGLEKKKLVEHSKKLKLKNVTFVGIQEKKLMPAIWASADIAIISLKKYIIGAVPSKLYEAMASSTSILLIGEGECADIVKKANCGITVSPGDIYGIVNGIKEIIISEKDRMLFSSNARLQIEMQYNRKLLMQKLTRVLEKNVDS
tara:strand:- start:2749 stop:3933 length:1185 start_codon:yes stop_codon:yes gene_type:complete